MVRRALITGSFDPITYGHIDIIKRASSMFDELVIGIIKNPRKQGLFTIEERTEMIEKIFSGHPEISVDHFQGLLADYVNQGDFCAVVRGLRTDKDFAYELEMAQVNQKLFHEGIESVFLMARPEYTIVSSSNVREIVSVGGTPPDGMVPDEILQKMREKYAQRG
jgi:pantetheine-phosphate adenylyltransferase